jgi:hypothetical protein
MYCPVNVEKSCSRTLGCIPLKIVAYLIPDRLILPWFWGKIEEKAAILNIKLGPGLHSNPQNLPNMQGYNPQRLYFDNIFDLWSLGTNYTVLVGTLYNVGNTAISLFAMGIIFNMATS